AVWSTASVGTQLSPRSLWGHILFSTSDSRGALLLTQVSLVLGAVVGFVACYLLTCWLVVLLLCAHRALVGLSNGTTFCAVPSYLAEIPPQQVRTVVLMYLVQNIHIPATFRYAACAERCTRCSYRSAYLSDSWLQSITFSVCSAATG